MKNYAADELILKIMLTLKGSLSRNYYESLSILGFWALPQATFNLYLRPLKPMEESQ